MPIASNDRPIPEEDPRHRSAPSAVRADRVAERVQAVPGSGIRRFFDIIASMDQVISLGVGEPDFVTPWPISEAAIRAIEQGHTHYTSNLRSAGASGSDCGGPGASLWGGVGSV